MLLPVYDFLNANKLFALELLSASNDSKNHPLGSILSFLSYLLQHAYRTSRASLYSVLAFTILRIILEDPASSKRLVDPTLALPVRLCRQRPPYLPATPAPRPAAAHILDLAVDALNHNLRRRLDLDLYAAAARIVHRVLARCAADRAALPYHWPLLWQSLLALLRFLRTYAADVQQQPADPHALLEPLLKSLVLAVARGAGFLPDPAAYDDLFYKLVEQADTLRELKAAYRLSGGRGAPTGTGPASSGDAAPPTAASTAAGTVEARRGPIDVLIAAAAHFHGILEEWKQKGRARRTLSAQDVSKAIREGYESLEVVDLAGMGIDTCEAWREGEERGMLKRVARMAVEDARKLVRERD